MSQNDATNPGAVDDTVVDNTEVDNAAVTETSDDDFEDTGVDESDEGGDEAPAEAAAVDDTDEIEVDGQKYRVPKAIKGGYLREADYTRKTQELSEARKTFETSRDATLANDEAYVSARADVRAIDVRLDEYADTDWQAAEQLDPAAAAQHWRIYSQLKEARGQAETAASGAKDRITLDQQRTRATRVNEVQAMLPKIVDGWSAELDTQLGAYGQSLKLSPVDMAEMTLRNPIVVSVLNKARLYDELKAKEKTASRITTLQKSKPAVEVGAKAPSTTDPDKMNTADWVKWRNAQERKNNTR